MTDTPKTKPHGALSFALDFGPLLAFFIAYKLTGIFVSTAVFMVAIVVALVVSLAVLKRVSPMTWMSAILVVGFGGLTLYLNDPRFIQLKPTIIYAGFALLLFAGLAAKKPLLRYVFGPIFEGLNETGWLKLSRNWAIFFAAMAVLNEGLRAWLSFETWLTVKVWGVTALSMAFAMANIPMLLRHGFSVTEAKEEPPIPPQG
ncbi:septation protein IspZ [Sphingosinicella humi]|uniref:Inner membrane-spanning protein YciB n=1 Tax=Allosphingosinicella humi TaxID=2068657 RepID=A0A2U2J5M2_9SPHN|nr:septation protein IspZ [Sphingosinicella humi]PWG03617.1 septation protein IspZ [Sphingosinicella humi]